jgi:hypothetical protein
MLHQKRPISACEVSQGQGWHEESKPKLIFSPSYHPQGPANIVWEFALANVPHTHTCLFDSFKPQYIANAKTSKIAGEVIFVLDKIQLG